MTRAAAAVVAMVLMLVMAGCGDDKPAGKLYGKVLDPPFKVSATPLVDTDGQPYSLASDTHKRLTLVFFGYTHCPNICQTVMGSLASAMTRLSKGDRDQVDVVFVTTDPERDTGPALRTWLDRYDPSFIGVTGDIDDIAAVGRSIAVGMGEKLPTGGYDVDAHTTQITGIDSADEAPVYWGQTTSSAHFAADIHTLLGKS